MRELIHRIYHLFEATGTSAEDAELTFLLNKLYALYPDAFHEEEFSVFFMIYPNWVTIPAVSLDGESYSYMVSTSPGYIFKDRELRCRVPHGTVRTFACMNCGKPGASRVDEDIPTYPVLRGTGWFSFRLCTDCLDSRQWRPITPEAARSVPPRFLMWTSRLISEGQYVAFLPLMSDGALGTPPEQRQQQEQEQERQKILKRSVVEHLKEAPEAIVPVVENYTYSPFERYDKVYLHTNCPPKNGRYYGVELEVEAGDRDSYDKAIDAIAKLTWPFGILAQDGSLRGGFEIKTLPATLDAHRLLWAEFFKGKPYRYVSSWPSGRCGMHVHISSDSITPLTLGKLNVFFNSPKTRRLINLVAGRPIGVNQYCYPNKMAGTITSAYVSDKTKSLYKAVKNIPYNGKQRWNFVHHNAFVGREISKPTYELRIFRGNLSPSGFFKNLEFTDAVIAWAENTAIANINSGNFLAWLKHPENLGEYRHLGAFLSSKGTISSVPGQTVYLGEEVGHAD